MYEIRFKTIVNEDRTIRIPEHVSIKPGSFEVVIMPAMTDEERKAGNKALITRLIEAGRELNSDAGLPSDFAENHDHYIHGLPKGIDKQ
jgi:hypothetical protein